MVNFIPISNSRKKENKCRQAAREQFVPEIRANAVQLFRNKTTLLSRENVIFKRNV